MLKKLFISVFVVLVAIPVVSAAKEESISGVDLLPLISVDGKDVSVAAYINFERLVKTGLLDIYWDFFQSIAMQKPESKSSFEFFSAGVKSQLDAIGFDFKRDLKKIFVCINGKVEGNDFNLIVLIQTAFNEDKILGLLKEAGGGSPFKEEMYKGTRIYFSEFDNLAFTFIDNELIALGTSKDTVKQVIAAHKGTPMKRPAAGRFVSIWKDLDKNKIAWEMVYISKSLKDKLKDEAKDAAKYISVFLDIDYLFASVDYDGKNEISEGWLFCGKDKSHRMLADAIIGVKNIVKIFFTEDPLLFEAIDNLKITQDDKFNSVSWKWKVDLNHFLPFIKDIIAKNIEKEFSDEPVLESEPEEPLEPENQ